jgi:hypothetical protein
MALLPFESSTAAAAAASSSVNLAFLLLHDLPDIMQDGPMVHWYICLFTLFNVKFIMLMNVHVTRRISSLMKSPALHQEKPHLLICAN